MRGKIVVDEELTVHEVEGDIMHSPDEHEEPGRVPQTVANGYGNAGVNNTNNGIDGTNTHDQVRDRGLDVLPVDLQ